MTHEPPLVFDVERDPAESIPLNITTDVTTTTTLMNLTLAQLVELAESQKAAHIDSASPLPPPQYGPQNWSLVPCCPWASFDPQEAAHFAEEGQWGLAIWDGCVCPRNGSVVSQ